MWDFSVQILVITNPKEEAYFLTGSWDRSLSDKALINPQDILLFHK
jgi:hypothetical protein